MNKAEKNVSDPGSGERRITIIICLLISVYLAVCAGIYCFTTIGEQNSYVDAEAMTRSADIVPADRIVNINTATAEELKTLSGVGDATAERIIDYRETNGGFLYPEELINVNGIGEKSFEKIRPYITV